MKTFISFLSKMQIQVAVFFAVSFFSLFLSFPIIRHQSALRYFSSGEADSRTRIRVPPGGFIIYQSHLLLLQYHHKLFLHFLNRDDCLLLIASYTAARRIMFLDDCCLYFARRTIIGSSVLGTCTSIGATIWRGILLISSVLATEDT